MSRSVRATQDGRGAQVIASGQTTPARLPRILIVNNTSRISAGTTRSLLLNLKYLHSKYSFCVAAPADAEGLPTALSSLRIPFFPLSSSRLSPVTNLAGLTRVMAREGYDLIYANNLGDEARAAFWAAKLLRRPFIWHVREMLGSKRRAWTVKYADAVVACSQDTALRIVTHAGYRAPIVIPNGVDLADFGGDRAKARNALRDELHLPRDCFLILNLGHVCALKNQLDAVEVTRLVLDKYPSARLACIGNFHDIEYARKVQERVRQQGLSEKVHLLGYRSDAPACLLGADMFLHTSSRESHPRSVLEAMAAGLPVVAYGVGGVPESVVDGVAGFIVPPGDVRAAAEAICRLMGDSELRVRMGEAGRARVSRRFTAEKTARSVDNLIQSVLLGRRQAKTEAR